MAAWCAIMDLLTPYYLNENVDPTNVYTLNNAPGVSLAVAQESAKVTLLTDVRGIDGKLPENHLTTYVLPPSQSDAD